ARRRQGVHLPHLAQERLLLSRHGGRRDVRRALVLGLGPRTREWISALLRGWRRSAMTFEVALPRSAWTSSGVRLRHLPIGRAPIRTGPMATRTSFSTLLSTASSMRRTLRLRPSVMVISRKLYFSLSRSRVSSAGRVTPSASSTPWRKRSICASLTRVDALI